MKVRLQARFGTQFPQSKMAVCSIHFHTKSAETGGPHAINPHCASFAMPNSPDPLISGSPCHMRRKIGTDCPKGRHCEARACPYARGRIGSKSGRHPCPHNATPTPTQADLDAAQEHDERVQAYLEMSNSRWVGSGPPSPASREPSPSGYESADPDRDNR